jgi:AraC family transcriptional regulator, regulatory protein of adaptative response / methylated-DNA-[protein]-cysteine methyltransferase
MAKQPDWRGTYDTVAEAIRFVRARSREQPSLEDVARHVGLSPQHLQRMFTAWAGISPKRFLQFLTKESARQLLRQSRDVLTVAVDSGLSGPGRLHDLMVACEALTPGEVGSLGEGLTIRFGFAPTRLGEIIVGATARGVCHLRFLERDRQLSAERELRREWPHARFARDDVSARTLGAQLFGPLAERRALSVLLRGTNFQIKVWEALLRIPPGHVASYGDLALLAGAPKAYRAVGTAVARNQIAVLVPCHRVIRESGDLGQYRWGADRKSALLTWERARYAEDDGGLAPVL